MKAISIPFLVHWQVEQNTTEEHPQGILKIGLSLLGVLLLMKGCQMMKGTVLRSPLRSGNY